LPISVAGFQRDLKVVAVRDRGGVNAGHHILAVLREAPPLLFGLVGRHAVDCFYIQTVLGFFAFDKLLLLQCLAQKFRVGREAEFIGGRVGVYDG